jgi:hypothetical protein
MKTISVLLALCLLVLCGCASQYVMKLSDGRQITTPHKPKLKGADYVYKDAYGKDHKIPQGRVLEIEPAKMAAEEKKPQPIQYRPPKNHWWQFWR